jgi:opacity protein-like surface antigen
MKTQRAVCAALAALVLCAAPRARADDDHKSRAGTTFGLRGMYFNPKGADDGSWSGGAQLRFHMSNALAIEGSADWRQNKFGGTVVDVYPVQASLLVYLLPDLPISPFILGGGGWYYTHVHDQPTQNRFGPHAGAGLEFFIDRHWSIDGTYRYVWLSDVNSPNNPNPLRRDYSDSGSMVTAAVNYRW